MQGSLFQRSSWSKAPLSKKDKEDKKLTKPAAIRLGAATLEIGPHIFPDTRFYALDYSKERKPKAPKKSIALENVSLNGTPQLIPAPESIGLSTDPTQSSLTENSSTPAVPVPFLQTAASPATPAPDQMTDAGSTTSTTDMSELVFEFTSLDLRIGEGERYLVPRETILQRTEGPVVLMSLLLIYPQDMPLIYCPVTLRITSCTSKLCEYLFNYVHPQEEVRAYMKSTMQTLQRSNTGWLQYQLSAEQREIPDDMLYVLAEKVSKRDRERQLKEEDDLMNALSPVTEPPEHKRVSSSGRLISSPNHSRMSDL